MNAHAHTVQQRFGNEAETWHTQYERPAARSIYAHNLQRRKQHVLDLLKNVRGRVLEIGCGAGNIILSLPDTADIRRIGADFARPMLHRARENARAQGATLPLLAADATRMPFRAGIFDAILCLGVLEYIPGYRSVLSECHRLLTPGGSLIVSVPNRASPFIRVDDLGLGLKNALTHSLPAGLRRWLKTRVLGRPDRPYFNHQKQRFCPLELEASLKTHGFRVETARYHTYGFALLNGLGLNLSLSERIESRAATHKNLEKLGWTCILKATRQ